MEALRVSRDAYRQSDLAESDHLLTSQMTGGRFPVLIRNTPCQQGEIVVVATQGTARCLDWPLNLSGKPSAAEDVGVRTSPDRAAC